MILKQGKYFHLKLYRLFFCILFVVLISISVIILILYCFHFVKDVKKITQIDFVTDFNVPLSFLSRDNKSSLYVGTCTHWTCFNIYKCGHTKYGKISVYIYPPMNIIDKNEKRIKHSISKQYRSVLKAIYNSKYYSSNPHEACIFLPSVDTLNENNTFGPNYTSKIFTRLQYWNNGQNHLIFNMASGSRNSSLPTLFQTGESMLASASFTSQNFRVNFDVVLPVFSPIAHLGEVREIAASRPWLVTFVQSNLFHLFEKLKNLYLNNRKFFLFLKPCKNKGYLVRCELLTNAVSSYPIILQKSVFCIIFLNNTMSKLILMESMAANCIPVIISNEVLMPFHSVIDWKSAAVFIMDRNISNIIHVLRSISTHRIHQMQKNIKFLYSSYFDTMERITLTVLDIIQDRVFPQWQKSYEDWNFSNRLISTNPLFLPITSSKSQGFTALILTYDRVDSLFTLIRRLAKVQSVSKILVVWNNQNKKPPLQFPSVQKQLKVIQTSANKLSNRFFPFNEIETEAILHIDDDILMLTADEIEFAFDVWREFPDRIVGFPSRLHVWDNATSSWKYESEWTNEISMVLTGAAFLHKYWSFVYTTSLPLTIKNWVDAHMNCEDIAMNFVVANITKKAPIKVAPRKKFKCPQCTNNEILSADLGHMTERTQCINKFAKIFGYMPLRAVEFRADPVLYKDAFPDKLKRYKDIGNL